jgi:predicted RNase H-like HicB family nuclease
MAERMIPEQLSIVVHIEDGAFWATVDEFPGVFATGDTLEELRESLEEGVSLYLSERGNRVTLRIGPLRAQPVETSASAQLASA